MPTVFTDEEGTVEFARARRRAVASAKIGGQLRGTARGYETALDGFFDQAVEVGRGRGLSAVRFELVNFPLLEGMLPTTAGPWTLAIAPKVPAATFDILRREGGYALTATGRVERSDGRRFTAHAANEVLDSLFHFLSFAVGAWSAPTLLAGLDDHDNVIWNRWEISRTSPWSWHPHWLPRRGQQAAIDLFGQWHGRWADPYWKEVLGRATYFMMAANQPIVDVGLTTAQAALETLAYSICVTERKSLPATAFEPRSRYTAAARIRQMLTDMRLASTVPMSLTALTAFPHGSDGSDGPAKLTWLRNRLAHPVKSARSATYSDETFEAWRLAIWYVEATLLSFLGYAGTVWNRVSMADEHFP